MMRASSSCGLLLAWYELRRARPKNAPKKLKSSGMTSPAHGTSQDAPFKQHAGSSRQQQATMASDSGGS